MSPIAGLQKTNGAKWVIAPRVIAGGMLLMFGVMHITGSAPMQPILEAANMPMPAVGAIVGPLGEIVAGLLLLSGAFARVGALLAIGVMGVAFISHLRGDWPDEPPIFLPFVVMIPAIVVLIVGAGKWSLDDAMTSKGGSETGPEGESA